jgi:hypothetical protein
MNHSKTIFIAVMAIFLMNTYDIFADSNNLKIVGTFDTPDCAYAVQVSGNYVYIADWDSGLQVINASNPAKPRITSRYNSPYLTRYCVDPCVDVCIKGDYAFLALFSSGLRILNISNPNNPKMIGSYKLPSYTYGAFVSGNYIFVATSDSGLKVINISDPTNPIYTAGYNMTCVWGRFYVSGKYAYITDKNSWIQVINISDPTKPIYAGGCRTSGTAVSVYVSGKYAYIANMNSGMQVINISDPTKPIFAGGCRTPDTAIGVYVSGKYAYIADKNSGMQVIDISDPTNPKLAGDCAALGFANSIYILGKYAYVTAAGKGLYIVDITSFNPDIIKDTITDKRNKRELIENNASTTNLDSIDLSLNYSLENETLHTKLSDNRDVTHDNEIIYDDPDARVFNFRGIAWGMTKNQVLQKEVGKRVPQLSGAHELVFKGKIAGLECEIIYSFDHKGKLSALGFGSLLKHSTNNLYIDDMISILNALTEKYGQPYIGGQIWHDDLYKSDPTDWGFALSLGHLEYKYTWKFGYKTAINLELSGDNYEIDPPSVYIFDLSNISEKPSDDDGL